VSFHKTTSTVRRVLVLGAATALFATALAGNALGHPEDGERAAAKGAEVLVTEADRQFFRINAIERAAMQASLVPVSNVPCSGGDAAGYSCEGVDLASFLPLSILGGGDGNDLWGWTDPATGRDYALMGRSAGTTFVEITNPLNPQVIGTLPAHSVSSPWRDIKVYDSHAFIVSEGATSGLQVFDLRTMATQAQRPHVFEETAWLGSFSTAHNIAINEETGFAYVVGANTCSGGLHMIDVSSPASPSSAGCFSADGYTHDVQCVIYRGPDPDHQGAEVCMASNEDTLTIVDVTDKTNPVQVSRTGYAGSGYVHQGWLTDDHEFLLADDEVDELSAGGNTRTYVWDLADLDNPTMAFVHSGTTPAIDHNQYIRDDRSYQADYTAGLRIVNTDRLALDVMKELAYFDTHPEGNGPQFDGAWSTYPFYRANIVAVSTIDRGLFILGYAGEGGSLHVADLDRRAVVKDANKWRAIGKVGVHDEDGNPVAGAVVTMRWANGKVKTCTTGPLGRCKTAIIRYNSTDRVGFRILDIEAGDMTYASWLNEDAEGDSNGFRKTVWRPSN